MPWCESCEKYRTPSSIRDDGTCPVCARPIEPIESAHATPASEHDHQGDVVPGGDGSDGPAGDAPVPWHFKLMIVLLVVYLVWRAWQLVTGRL